MSSAVFISKSTFTKNYFMNTNSVKNNSLDPDQAQCFVDKQQTTLPSSKQIVNNINKTKSVYYLSVDGIRKLINPLSKKTTTQFYLIE